MKKLFLSLMLVAAIVAGFTSCQKKDNESTTHTQTFTLGETSYNVDNAITIENIQYEGSEVYNAIVLYTGSLIGETGGEGKGVTIIFKGDINAGTYRLTGNEEAYPKYVFADVSVTDIVNFDMTELEDDDAYIATSGSLTLEISEGKYIITTENIEVENALDPTRVETSSTDYEGTVTRYVLATVEEGNLNNAKIATAGSTKVTLMMIEQKAVCFIAESGDMIGFTYQGDAIPTGTLENAGIIYVNAMNINAIQVAQSNVNIEQNGDIYTVDIPDVTINGTTYTMHYVGTLPYFDFPF